MRTAIIGSLYRKALSNGRRETPLVFKSFFSYAWSLQTLTNRRATYAANVGLGARMQRRFNGSVPEATEEHKKGTMDETEVEQHQDQECQASEELEEQEDPMEQEEPVDLSKHVEELEAKLAEATEKLKEMQLKYRLCLDNLEQVEKISAKKLDNANLYAITRFSKDILDVADTFELAFKALDENSDGKLNNDFVEGIKLTESQLHKTFEKYGIKRFESLQQPFNPEIHEAMFEIPNESVEKNTILQVVLNGYMIHDRVLRPAKVGVSRKG